MTQIIHYKKCLSNFATGVTIVTVLDQGNKAYGVTINSFASLSLHPPLILFNLGKHSRIFDQVVAAKYFAVNILSNVQINLSKQFSSFKLSQNIDWDMITDFAGPHTGCPILKNSLGYLECENYQRYEGGDHLIFIGKVVNHSVLNTELDPLLYFRSNYKIPEEYK